MQDSLVHRLPQDSHFLIVCDYRSRKIVHKQIKNDVHSRKQTRIIGKNLGKHEDSDPTRGS